MHVTFYFGFLFYEITCLRHLFTNSESTIFFSQNFSCFLWKQSNFGLTPLFGDRCGYMPPQLTLLLPNLVTWRSYKGWFRPWSVRVKNKQTLESFDLGALKWLNFQLRWSTIDHSDIERENVNFCAWQISALASNEAPSVEWLQFAVVVLQKNLAR